MNTGSQYIQSALAAPQQAGINKGISRLRVVLAVDEPMYLSAQQCSGSNLQLPGAAIASLFDGLLGGLLLLGLLLARPAN